MVEVNFKPPPVAIRVGKVIAPNQTQIYMY